jgi:23S rRNA maturation-related 3'-5' exoribonuclease YhaM
MQDEPSNDKDLLSLFAELIDDETQREILEILFSTRNEDEVLDRLVRTLGSRMHDND